MQRHIPANDTQAVDEPQCQLHILAKDVFPCYLCEHLANELIREARELSCKDIRVIMLKRYNIQLLFCFSWFKRS